MMRAIIVDDEELSVKRLTRILRESGKIATCRAFLNPHEAYEYSRANAVDIAFLDISMPEIDGMKLSVLLQELDEEILLVFVTGYDSYAVQAFEVNALDYLLKPVTAQRVAKALNKAGKRSGRAAGAAASALEIKLFDGFQMYGNGDGSSRDPIKLRSPKTAELFAFLVCQRTASREEIIDTLWSGLTPEKAWKNLNSTLYYIRKALDDAKIGSGIISGKNEIRIEGSALDCDLYEFERLLAEMRKAPERCLVLIERVKELYAGPLLKGKNYEWADEYARRLEKEFAEALEYAAKHCSKQGDSVQALHYYRGILELDALREDIVLEVIRTYIQLGRTNEALRQYRKLEEQLKQELGLRPNPQIQAVMASIGLRG
ncbi:BTAD domain-containing putative transcriptional regulator [Paenibacillus sp. FSL R5-0527]|uniref:BTAD domain-containing putative transcriptional regulator n=1 Tax=Paenibacillus sp. FSL R5-0527 TaxID=2975321 RepID=UPI00097A9357|nr:hypothetical protein BK140_02690 [Paenibacillus macerans]